MDEKLAQAHREQWLGKDIHDHQGQAWRLKVDTLTMSVLVCVRDVPSPFSDYPDALPGQLLIQGEPWASLLVATTALYVLDRMQDLVGLEVDVTAARIAALEGLRQKGRKLREMADNARRNHDKAVQELHQTKQKLGLVPPGPPAKRPPV